MINQVLKPLCDLERHCEGRVRSNDSSRAVNRKHPRSIVLEERVRASAYADVNAESLEPAISRGVEDAPFAAKGITDFVGGVWSFNIE